MRLATAIASGNAALLGRPLGWVRFRAPTVTTYSPLRLPQGDAVGRTDKGWPAPYCPCTQGVGRPTAVLPTLHHQPHPPPARGTLDCCAQVDWCGTSSPAQWIRFIRCTCEHRSSPRFRITTLRRGAPWNIHPVYTHGYSPASADCFRLGQHGHCEEIEHFCTPTASNTIIFKANRSLA